MTEQGRLCPLCNATLGSDFCPTHGVPTLVTSDLEGPPAPIELGTVIGGRYRIEKLLSQGGMGAVLLATQLGIARSVVVKVVKPAKDGLLNHLKRFYREAIAMSRLNHPNIVRVHEFGVDVPTRTPFLIMEHVEGETLRDVVDDQGPMSEARAARLLVQVGRALLEAHNHGVLHRDLKPRNIMVRRLADGEELVKVLDFGLARISEGDNPQPPLTQPGKTIGTPAYMSPEQVVCAEQDARTDLYGLGCVLHMVLTGSAPYVGNDLIDTMRMHLNAELPSLPDRLADGEPPSDDLRSLHQRLLAKRRTERPTDAAEVVQELFSLAAFSPRIPKLQPMAALDEDEHDATTSPSLDGVDESSDALLTIPATDTDLARTELGTFTPQEAGALAMALGSGIAPRAGTGSHDSIPELPPQEAIDSEAPDNDAWTSVLPSSLEPGDSGLTPNEATPPRFEPTRHGPVEAPARARPSEPLHLVVPEPPPRSPILVLALSFILVLGAGAAMIMIGSDDAKTPPEAAAASAEPPPQGAPQQEAPTAVPVAKAATAMLQSQPTGAQVFFAGVLLGKTPLEVELPMSGVERSVSVELDGFQDARVSLHADSPQVIFVPLSKRVTAEAKPKSKRDKQRPERRRKRRRKHPKSSRDPDAEVPVW